jgi:DNA invertase Pin-like site-specific DNA recombinase
MKLVAYYRVSTERQGRSGLGLEAQRHAVEQYARQHGARVLESFTEIESGKRDDRPELARALVLTKVTGATLVIAKLDRLSRDAAFLLTLQKTGTRFVAADLPNADETTVGVLAIVAQRERDATSKRTKEALAAAKARGTKLGNPNGAAALRRADKGNSAAIAAVKAQADQQAQRYAEIVDHVRREGATSLGAIAAALNAREVLTPRGKQWHKTTVRNLLARLEAA